MQGILMKPDMIQATVEGRKTNTRRLIQPQPRDPQEISFNGKLTYREKVTYPGGCYFGDWQHIRPRYHVGETCYIKETHYRYGHWRQDGVTKSGRRRWAFEALTNTIRYLEDTPLKVQRGRKYDGWYKRSALFMPASAARHFIFIEAVRAGRLQEITREGIKAEGILATYHHCNAHSENGSNIPSSEFLNYYSPFVELWDSINPAYPFDSNPWVWAYQFRLETPRCG